MKKSSCILKKIACLLCFVMIFTVLPITNDQMAYAQIYLEFEDDEIRISPGETKWISVIVGSVTTEIIVGVGDGKKEEEDELDNIEENLVWKTSDPSVVDFETDGGYSGFGIGWGVRLHAVSEGVATVTVKEKTSKASAKCIIRVADTILTSAEDMFYSENTYQLFLEGKASAVSYSSSDSSIASVDAVSGIVTTKKAGTCEISCVGNDGKTYTYEMKINKSCLSYTKMTKLYSDEKEKLFKQFPLVAKGIQVKSWTSSNKKVCKVTKTGSDGNIGILTVTGPGKCTITCTSQTGKKYTCKLTVQDGKRDGKGYDYNQAIKLSQLKKYQYYNDINTIQDYGNAIVCFYTHEDSKINNGNSVLSDVDFEKVEDTLKKRYPDKTVVYKDYYLEYIKDYDRVFMKIYYIK